MRQERLTVCGRPPGGAGGDHDLGAPGRTVGWSVRSAHL